MTQRASGAPDASARAVGRWRSNLAVLVATCAVLVATAAVSDGGFANSIDRITKNLDVALQDLMDDLPRYTNFTENREYVSGATFNPMGMAGLYNITRKFLDLVLEPDFLMDGLISVQNGDIKLQSDVQVTEVLRYYWGVVLVVAILAVLAVLIPICGLCFCCCRCCGNCGARSQPCDKKRDLCKKIVQGTLLIVLGTALLFCVVCAFASNQQLQDGIDGLPKHMQNAKQDTNTYLDSTKDQATHLLVLNYREFSDVFSSTMNKSSEYVMDQLKIWSNATAMTDLHTFVIKMPDIRRSLETLKTDTNTLRASASQLNDAMRKVKRDLLLTLERCSTKDCKDIQSNISQLQTNIDFNRLPDVSPAIARINDLNLTGIESAAKEGNDMLINIRQDIHDRLDTTLTDATNKVNEAGVTIKQNLDNITKVISNIQDQIDSSVDPAIRDVNKYISYYGQYRYYGGLAISCILLLVTICIALGLICGICGKRPDRYNDNCCNKGAGSQFLICAVMLMFIFGMILALVTLAMFATGIASDRVVCYPFRNPEDSRIMSLLDDYLTQNPTMQDFSIKSSLVNCYQNKSIYNVLNLRNQFDIDTVRDKFDISSVMEMMNSSLNGIIDTDIEIISPDNMKTLEDLKSFDPNINFEQFQDELKQNFTNLSLNEISKKLEDLVQSIQDDIVPDGVRTDLQLSILHINTYDEKLLQPMIELANKVINISKQLDTDLKMNSSSFSEAIENLLNEIQEAQTALRTDGTEMVQKVAREFGTMVLNQVESYLDRVTYVIKEEFGQCGPMNVAISATLTSACDKIILPWNGFWLSLLLSLVLFIPTIIVSVKLASLYQKYKQFGGQYVETEYLYDAYADRGDNIPLNGRGAKRGKKKGKKSKYYEDRPQNMGGEVVSREHATGSHPPDTRYSDMAPKHWEEFPNGGPPQYQRAPTEYERPPPYYYPGTGDQ